MIKLRDRNLKLAFKNLFQATKKDLVVIEPHLGLGDNLICLGLVRKIAAQRPTTCFYYACLQRCYHSLSWMFFDLPNVYLFAVRSGRQARQYADFLNATYLPIGIENVDIKRFDAFFYEQHGVDFNLRWSDAKTPAGPRSQQLLESLNPKCEPYILVCNEESGHLSYELRINNPQGKKIIYVKPLTHNIFDWTLLALHANEIHTIDTAFVHFIESLFYQRNAPPLFYHLARQSATEFTRRLPWQVINYS